MRSFLAPALLCALAADGQLSPRVLAADGQPSFRRQAAPWSHPVVGPRALQSDQFTVDLFSGMAELDVMVLSIAPADASAPLSSLSAPVFLSAVRPQVAAAPAAGARAVVNTTFVSTVRVPWRIYTWFNDSSSEYGTQAWGATLEGSDVHAGLLTRSTDSAYLLFGFAESPPGVSLGADARSHSRAVAAHFYDDSLWWYIFAPRECGGPTGFPGCVSSVPHAYGALGDSVYNTNFCMTEVTGSPLHFFVPAVGTAQGAVQRDCHALAMYGTQMLATTTYGAGDPFGDSVIAYASFPRSRNALLRSSPTAVSHAFTDIMSFGGVAVRSDPSRADLPEVWVASAQFGLLRFTYSAAPISASVLSEFYELWVPGCAQVFNGTGRGRTPVALIDASVTCAAAAPRDSPAVIKAVGVLAVAVADRIPFTDGGGASRFASAVYFTTREGLYALDLPSSESDAPAPTWRNAAGAALPIAVPPLPGGEFRGLAPAPFLRTSPSPSPSPTSTESPTPSPTSVESPTPSPTALASPTASPSTTESPTLSPSPSPTVTQSQTPDCTQTPSQSPSATPSDSTSSSPTTSETATPTTTLSLGVTPSATASQTSSAAETPSPTTSSTPTLTPTPSHTESSSASPTGTTSTSASPPGTTSTSASPTPSVTATRSFVLPSVSATPSASPTASTLPSAPGVFHSNASLALAFVLGPAPRGVWFGARTMTLFRLALAELAGLAPIFGPVSIQGVRNVTLVNTTSLGGDAAGDVVCSKLAAAAAAGSVAFGNPPGAMEASVEVSPASLGVNLTGPLNKTLVALGVSGLPKTPAAGVTSGGVALPQSFVGPLTVVAIVLRVVITPPASDSPALVPYYIAANVSGDATASTDDPYGTVGSYGFSGVTLTQYTAAVAAWSDALRVAWVGSRPSDAAVAALEPTFAAVSVNADGKTSAAASAAIAASGFWWTACTASAFSPDIPGSAAAAVNTQIGPFSAASLTTLIAGVVIGIVTLCIVGFCVARLRATRRATYLDAHHPSPAGNASKGDSAGAVAVAGELPAGGKVFTPSAASRLAVNPFSLAFFGSPHVQRHVPPAPVEIQMRVFHDPQQSRRALNPTRLQYDAYGGQLSTAADVTREAAAGFAFAAGANEVDGGAVGQRLFVTGNPARAVAPPLPSAPPAQAVPWLAEPLGELNQREQAERSERAARGGAGYGWAAEEVSRSEREQEVPLSLQSVSLN